MNAQLQTCDDRRVLADPAERINAEHRLATSHRDQAIEHAVECGRLLLQVKQRLGHGEFIPWIESHCKFAYSTAARYMTAARQISTGVEISSLRTLFPSGRAPRKAIGTDKPPETAADRRSPRDTAAPAVAAPAPDDADQDGDMPSPEERAEYEAEMERESREYFESIDRVMQADDRLAAAQAEIRRLGLLVKAIESTRDGFMNGKTAVIEMLKEEQRKTARQSKLIDRLRAQIEELKAGSTPDTGALQRQIERLTDENEKLRERIAIMEESL